MVDDPDFQGVAAPHERPTYRVGATIEVLLSNVEGQDMGSPRSRATS